MGVLPATEIAFSKETEQTTPVWVHAGPVKPRQVPAKSVKRKCGNDVDLNNEEESVTATVAASSRPRVPDAAGAPEGVTEAGAPVRSGVLPTQKVGKARSIPPHPEKLIFGCSQCRQSLNGCRGCRDKLG